MVSDLVGGLSGSVYFRLCFKAFALSVRSAPLLYFRLLESNSFERWFDSYIILDPI